MNEITYPLVHERVMQVMRDCFLTRLTVEGGWGGKAKEQRMAETGRLGVCC